MDIFFQDPSEIPLPPDEVRIRDLRAEPWPDARRVRVYLELDPFQKRPSAELVLSDPAGDPAASVNIVESMTRKIELTMHLKNPMPGSSLTLNAKIFYLAPPPETVEVIDGTTSEESQPTVVDQRQIALTIPPSIE